MRIAVWHDLPSGGGRRALVGQLDGLLDRGHEVRVWSPPQSAGPLPLRDRGPHTPVQDVVAVPSATLREDRINTLRGRPPAAYVAMAQHGSAVARDVRRWKPDLLLAGSSVTLGAAPIALALPELPSVLYLQEPYRQHYEAPLTISPEPETSRGSLASARRRWGAAFDGARVRRLVDEERRSARAFDLVLVNSVFSQESVWRALGCVSSVCLLGVDDTVFVPVDAPRQDHVITVGQFARHKDPGFLVAALCRMDSPPALVWVANDVDSDLRREVSRQAQEGGLALDLRVGIPDAELVDLLGRARALVYAPVLEPFGYAPLEAALCRTPTVSIAVGGPRETVVDGVTGLLVPRDEASFAAAVQSLLDDPALADRLGRQARQHCLTAFSQSAALDRLERALLSAADA